MYKTYKDIPLIIDDGPCFMYTSSLIYSDGKIEPILHGMDIGFAVNLSLTKAYIYTYTKDSSKMKARLFFTDDASVNYLMIRNEKDAKTYVFRLDEESMSYSDVDKNGVILNGSFHSDIPGTKIQKNHFRPCNTKDNSTFFVTEDDTLLLRFMPFGAAAEDINKNLYYDYIVATEYITLKGKNDVEHYICLRSKNWGFDDCLLLPLEDILTNGRKIDYYKIKVEWERYKLRRRHL
jgi:hypothetical protein